MTLLGTLLAFLVALGSLIVIHEMGHYWVARWCGVKVLRFSVGMGKVVWSRRIGPDQTEWAVSMLPLGGYVKMLDGRDPEQDLRALPPEQLRREFTRQSVWRRIAIVAAGPLANFLLAIALFAGLAMYGSSEPASQIRVATPSSAAYVAGLRSGDTVLAVNDEAVALWSELRWQVLQAGLDKQGVRFDLERPGHGRVHAEFAAAQIARLDLDGDMLDALGIGLAAPPARLGQIVAGGAAERAGLRGGDLIVQVDGQPVTDFLTLVQLVRAAPAKPLSVLLMRDGRELALRLTPDPERIAAVTVGKIGAGPAQPPAMILVRLGPGAALAKAASKVWQGGLTNVKMIGKMLTGQLSLKNLTGPITIADYAGQTARNGALSYLNFIALISIALGVMNLLPIPVLDGGLLLYYSLEVLTGRPLPERATEIAKYIGIGLLLTMMSLAVFNDVARLMQ
ncbi:MAG: RIP metalloprotease RseP [Pseudomonadota bacterium]